MEKSQSFAKTASVQSIKPGDAVYDVFLLAAASQLQARNGPFWRLELRDATGSLEARIWSPYSQTFTSLATGSLVLVEGRAETFRDQMQMGVTFLRVLTEAECARLDLADFMPASQRPAADMLAGIEHLCDTVMVHKPWHNLATAILHDPQIRPLLLVATAAKAIHHAWVGGLLEHMLSVATVCMKLCDHYPQLDRQTLLAGALFHDIGKVWELSGGLANDYTDEGKLVGHLVLALGYIEKHLEASGLEPALALHFKHLILSHHGLYEYGAARLPQTAEAFALHYVDNIDAKLNQLGNLFANHEAGQADEGYVWSPYQNTLQRSVSLAPKSPEA